MKWLISTAIVLAAFIILITVFLQPNSFIGCTTERPPVEGSKCQKADAIVVVSGGDTQARTQMGIDLFSNGWADSLVLSGAAQDTTGPSNAAAMRAQALAAGVPDSAIVIDEEALNTQQNAENTRSIISDNNYTDVILVTSGYHQRRASLEFNKIADDVIIRNHPLQSDKDWGWFWWLTPRGWWLAGGELVKTVVFYTGVSQ